MGLLTLECVVKDEASMTMYALAMGPNYAAAGDASKAERLILVKSNARPSSANNISWTVVSTIGRDKLQYLYSKQSDRGLACAVDPNGVFTVFSYSSGPTTSIPSTSTPGGIQYDPTLPTTADTTGTGGWRNIMASANYGWKSSSSQSILFPVKEAGNKYSLVHVFANPTNEISFGTLTSSSTAFEPQSTVWKADMTTHGMSVILTYSSGTLYSLFSGSSKGSLLVTVPISSTSIPPFPVTSTPMPLDSTCIILPSTIVSALPGNRLQIVCMNSTVNGPTSKLYLYNGTSFQPEIEISKYFPFATPAVSLEGVDGKPAFMFVQDWGISNYITMGIDLEGPKAGTLHITDARVNVTDTYGTPFPSGRAPGGGGIGGTTNSENNDNGFNPAYIGAIVGGLMLMLTIVSCIIRGHRRRKLHAFQDSVYAEQKIQQVDPVEGANGPNTFQPNVQHAGGTGPYPTPVPLGMLEMSTHPRPQFFTSVAESSQPGGGPEAILGQDPSAVPLPPGAPVVSDPHHHKQMHQHHPGISSTSLVNAGGGGDNEVGTATAAWNYKMPYLHSNHTQAAVSTVSLSSSNPQSLPLPDPYHGAGDGTPPPVPPLPPSATANASSPATVVSASNYLATTSTTNLNGPQAYASPVSTSLSTSSTSSSPFTTATFTPLPAYPEVARPINNPHMYMEPCLRQPAGAAAGTSYAEFQREASEASGNVFAQQQPSRTQVYQDIGSFTPSSPFTQASSATAYSASPVPSSAGATYVSNESSTPIFPNHSQPPRHPQHNQP